MPVPIPCPNCKKPINLARTTLGKKIKCPSCGRSFVAGDAPDEPEAISLPPLAPPLAATPVPKAVRPTKDTARPAQKQGALRFLVFVLGLLGAASSGLLASQILAEVRPDLATLKLDIEQIKPYLNDAILPGAAVYLRTMAAYVLAGAAVLALLGCLLALGGRGFVPGLFLFAAFAAPLLLNERAYVFTIPLVPAGVMSLPLGATGRGSALRSLLQLLGGILAGAILMVAGMTRFQPPPATPGQTPPVVQPGNGVSPPPPSYTPEQVRDATPEFRLSAKQLLDECHQDPATAHKKYDGKVLEVSGVVGGCRSDAGNSTLALEGQWGDPFSLNCVMQEKECWARHGSGQKVKLKGGFFVSEAAVSLAETVVLESEPNPTPLYISELLAQQFESAPGTLLERFGNKDIIVEGEVLKTDSNKDARIVSLKGTNRTVIRCQFSQLKTDWKSGEKVRIFGVLDDSSDKEPTLVGCEVVTVPTTAHPPTPLPGPYDAAIKDPTAAAAMIDKAGAGVKLVPVDVMLAGVAMTMMAPVGSTVQKSEKSVEIRGGPKFAMVIKPGGCNLAAAQKYWLTDRLPMTARFIIALDNLVLRTIRSRRDGTWKPEPTFLCTRTLGHVDVRIANRDGSFSQDDCLLMLRCARTLALKPGYQPPKNLDALRNSGVTATRDGSKLSIRTDADFTDAAMPLLVQFAANAEELSLWSPLTDQGLAQVAGFKKLRRLEFFGDSGEPFNVDGTALKRLRDLKSLESLSISQAMLTDPSLLNLRPLTMLKTLSLDDVPVTGSSFRLLKGLRIASLSLDGTRIDDANLKHVGAFVNLDTLSLDYTKISNAGLGHLNSLKKLKELSLKWTAVSDAGMDQIKGLTALAELDLWGTKVGDTGVAALKTLPKLKTLTLSETSVTDEGLRNLVGAPALTSLALEKTAVTDAGIDHLKGIKTLRTLWLKNTKVSDAKIAELEKAGITVR
jgi:hypothetical protein